MFKNLDILNDTTLSTSVMCAFGMTEGTDKSLHGYTKVYHELMRDKRYSPIQLLEIGIFKGNSLRMWQDYFTEGNICGIDNGRKVPRQGKVLGKNNENPSPTDKRLLKIGETEDINSFAHMESDNIKCFVADQRNAKQLRNAFTYFNFDMFDYIIDDGQHYQEHQQKSLGLLFKNVKSDGYYIIEDVADHNGLLNGAFWGQKEKDVSDCTDLVFTEFIKTGKLNSPYMIKTEMQYIEENVKDIFMFDCCGGNNSPITGTSKLLVIKKK